MQPKTKVSFKERLDGFFEITKRKSSVRVEIIAGIVTFLAMCYILTLNPSIITKGVAPQIWGSVFIATAIGAFLGTFLMAILARVPLAQASGLGLNSMVNSAMAGFLLAGGTKLSFANTMVLVFFSGVLFTILSVVPYKKDKATGKWVTIREAVFHGMPKQLRSAISVGIGLFITIIGLINANVISYCDNFNFFTALDLLPFNNPAVWGPITGNGIEGFARYAVVFLVAFLTIVILSRYNVKGSVIIGVLVGTLVAWPLGVTSTKVLAGEAGVSWKFWENFQNFFSFSEAKGGTFFVLFTEGFNFPKGSALGCIIIVLTFSMIDMFDTMGTVVGCCTTAGLVDENGTPYNYNKIMMADSIATCAGAVLGTSTVTTFVESGSGVAAGGKTGLSALTTSVLFLVSIFLMPVFAFIPSAACSAALVYVGVLMMGNVKNIDFSDIKTAAPAFMTIVMMPFAYSITDGIGFGVLSFVVVCGVIYLVDLVKYHINKKQGEKPTAEISVTLAIVAIFFLVYFIVPTAL